MSSAAADNSNPLARPRRLLIGPIELWPLPWVIEYQLPVRTD